MNDFGGRLRVLVIMAAVFWASAAHAQAPAVTEGGRFRLSARQELTAVPLRGYGALAGRFWSASGERPPASILQIDCANTTKAKLLLAKYVSDLGLLPGVEPITIQTKRGPIAGRSIEGQGVITAVRADKRVLIVAAQRLADLTSLFDDNLSANLVIDAADGEVPVPSYLDRWDQHGFRFYYGPFTRPRGANGREVASYNPEQDFAFARDAGRAGIVLWCTPHSSETAEGLMNSVVWEWVLRACQKYHLPVGINCGLEDKNYWILNRFPEDAIRYQPEFLGSFYGSMNFGIGEILSWSAVESKDLALAQIQKLLRKLVDCDNIVNWLEPHEEMGHGPADLLVEYGPAADRQYREFLKLRYGTAAAVGARWFAQASPLKSWEDVRLPELAHFAGWGPTAIDLTGIWHISYDAACGVESASPSFDDSAWPTLMAPGHSIVRFLTKRPAVFRRHIQIDSAWRAAHPKVWIYLWDMNDTRPKKDVVDPGVHVFVNGKAIANVPASDLENHWEALDVSSELTAGDNLITLDLPQGMFNYRCYLSDHEPKQYPYLGREMNAQWADYCDFNSWVRGQAVRRGAQMIRQVDPNRPITFMSPDSYASEIKAVCEDYGGVFHNTGYMAGVWANFHCMEMASSGLPTDAEPGSGAVDAPDFKRFMGRWITEGVQGVDYFQHIGDIEWRDGIRAHFLKTLNLWHLIGKYHTPFAQAAIFNSDRLYRLEGFPWRAETGAGKSGHWPVRINEWLLADFPLDEVMDGDFDRGNAAQYRVIIDTNTRIMDRSLVDGIEKWVRAGGVFVTYGQTGRHTSTDVDSWPISRISGYGADVLPRGRNQTFHLAPGQSILHDPAYWAAHNHGDNLLVLKKQQPECQDLLLWNDGTVAAGVRPLGKGYVIQLGTMLGMAEVRQLFGDILDSAKVARVPGSADGVLMRHFVSNNGLYDVWAMWNDKDVAKTVDLVIRNGVALKAVIDVETGKPLAAEPVEGGVKVGALQIGAFETRVFLSPKCDVASAPLDWFSLQRKWWKGTANAGKPFPDEPAKLAVDLTDDWAFQAVSAEQTNVPAMIDPKFDDSAWMKTRLGIVNIPDHPGMSHAIVRRRFTVPAAWNAGRVCLWIQSVGGDTFLNSGCVYVDGQPIGPASRNGVPGVELGGALRAGTSHVIAIDITGSADAPLGVRGLAWLSYHPTPAEKLDLTGPWEISADGLRYSAPVYLPAKFVGKAARQIVKIDASHSRQNVVVHAVTENYGLSGVLVNGRFVLRFRDQRGPEINLNITPWVKFGQENELILVGAGGNGILREASLEFHANESYP